MDNKIIKVLAETLEENKDEGWAIDTDGPWTKYLIKIMESVGEKTDNYVQARGLKNPHNSGEYLNIDVLFFRNIDFKEKRKPNEYDEPVMPIAAVELENSRQEKKIVYCLWKLLCLKASTKLLICYQANEDKGSLLKKHLQEKILEYSLMVQDKGSLFVIIGNERANRKHQWWDYYRAFEWGNDKLNEVKIFSKL